jgi:hypothetical protein
MELILRAQYICRFHLALRVVCEREKKLKKKQKEKKKELL